MIELESYKGHQIMAIHCFRAWECFVCYAPYQWTQSRRMFRDSSNAIAYGKEQIDILLSKHLNINKP